jgi:hypothetical protein
MLHFISICLSKAEAAVFDLAPNEGTVTQGVQKSFEMWFLIKYINNYPKNYFQSIKIAKIEIDF